MTNPEIHLAIEAGDGARVRALIAADPAAAGARDAHGVSAVMKAVYWRRAELVEGLLAAAPPLDVFEAAALGNEARLAALLAADPTLASAWSADGATALHFAAFFRRPGAARLLLDHGAEPAIAARGFGTATPLHSATASRCHEIVRMLLERGAPVDAVQEGGWTALMSAAHSGDRELAGLLLSFGADTRCKANDGSDAAGKAAEAGFAEIAAWLRDVRQGLR